MLQLLDLAGMPLKRRAALEEPLRQALKDPDLRDKAVRFGARDAHLYLGSPATVAASAIAGIKLGTTTTAGANNKGTLWAWTAASGVQNLCDFGTAAVGAPAEGLAIPSEGTVYGVTAAGGANGNGRLWKWTFLSGLSVVGDFDQDTTGTIDAESETGLMIANDGFLYGTCANGGANGVGTRVRGSGVASMFGVPRTHSSRIART